MKKLWFVNICITLAGVLGAANFSLDNSLIEGFIIVMFGVATFSIGYYPKFMSDCYWAHINRVCPEPETLVTVQAFYTGLVFLFLFVCVLAAVGSIWFNHSLATAAIVLFAPTIVGAIIGRCSDGLEKSTN